MTFTKYRKTFEKRGTNDAQLNAGDYIAISNIKDAEKDNNLPHNTLVISNQDSICTLYIFLDDFSNQEEPDYIVFPKQSIALGIEDGEAFSTVYIKNSDTVNNISANSIKYNIGTVKELV